MPRTVCSAVLSFSDDVLGLTKKATVEIVRFLKQHCRPLDSD